MALSINTGLIIVLIIIIMAYIGNKYLTKNMDSYAGGINRLLSKHCDSCPPVFDPKEFAWTQPFRDNWEQVRDEFIQYTDKINAPAYSAINPIHSACNLNGGWNTIFLRAFGADTDIIHEFPKTMRLIKGAPCTLAFFSILEPGAQLAPHEGIYKGVIRYHLGLIIPEDNKNCFIEIDGNRLYWKEGGDLMFDDLYTHYVQNNTNQRRVILFLDIKRDFNNLFINLLNTFLLRTIRSNDMIKSTVRNANKLNAQHNET